MSAAYWKYLRGLMGGILVTLVCVAVTNAMIDPFGIYRSNGSPFRDGIGTRLGKAQALAAGSWEVVLLGNSRVEVGLDPQHRGWRGARVFNGGLPGAMFDETDRAARLAIGGHRPREIVLCVDLADFDAGRAPADEDSMTRLNPSINSVDYYLGTLLSVSALQRSVTTVKNRMNDRRAMDWRQGQLDEHFVNHGAADWVAVPKYYNFSGAEGATADLYLDQGRMQRLEKLLDDATAMGIRVDLVVLPTHVIFFERVILAGKWQTYLGWINDLSAMVERQNQKYPENRVALWDFCSYSKFTTEAYPTGGQTETDMRWYWDPGHFKKALGDLVIDRLTGYPPPEGEDISDFGVRLDRGNVGGFLERLSKEVAENEPR